MKRKTPLRRSGRIKPKKRSRTEFKRIYGSPARAAWITSMPCYTCGRVGQTEQAHLQSGGMGRKADAETIVGLCHWCHAESHQIGLEQFAANHNLTVQDLWDRAAELVDAWGER